jgi:hypothetical protein
MMTYNIACHDILVLIYSGGKIPAELASLLWTTSLEEEVLHWRIPAI